MLFLLGHALALPALGANEPKAVAGKAEVPAAAGTQTSGSQPAALQPADLPLNPRSTDPQREAESLLERARHLSDIRGPNAPPFRLKATFSFVGDDLETFEGTYTEFWVSDSEWRKEIVIGDRKRTEIGRDSKLWEAESGPMIPEKASRVEFATSVFPARSAKLDFESLDAVVNQQAANERATRCAITKAAGSSQERSALCFDQTIGVLVQYTVPQWARYHITDFACSYGEFKKFGDQWFPYEITCRQGGHRQMEVQVAALDAENFNDVKLFEPPAGSIELGRCIAGEVSPKLDYARSPMELAGNPGRISSVTVRLVVDIKGKPQDVKIVRSGGDKFDRQAIELVRGWQFRAATCNGQPMAKQIEVQVPFRTF
ncbi:MAG: energy transducer TonB [Terriglobales bacterium]